MRGLAKRSLLSGYQVALGNLRQISARAERSQVQLGNERNEGTRGKSTMLLEGPMAEDRLGPFLTRYRYDKNRALRGSLGRLGFFWACGIVGTHSIIGRLIGGHPDLAGNMLALALVIISMGWLTYEWAYARNFLRVSYKVFQNGIAVEVEGREPRVIPFSEVTWMRKAHMGLIVKLAGIRMVRVHANWIQSEDGDPVEGIHRQFEEWKRLHMGVE